MAQAYPATNSDSYPKARPTMGHGLPFFFEVSSPICPKTRFWLLGTQHNLAAEYLPAEISAVIEEADVLVKEVAEDIFGDAGDISLKELALHGLASHDNFFDWTSCLSPKARSFFDRHIAPAMKQAWGVEPNRISPVVVDNVISEWGTSLASTIGMDTFLKREFAARGKPVCALEDGKIRFDACDTLFDLSERHRNSSREDLVFTLEQKILSHVTPPVASVEQKTAIDYSDYFSDNLDNILPPHGIRDLQKRNIAWIDAIERLIERFDGKTILFAFGFAHLAGDYGILTLLTNLGYVVKKRDAIV